MSEQPLDRSCGRARAGRALWERVALALLLLLVAPLPASAQSRGQDRQEGQGEGRAATIPGDATDAQSLPNPLAPAPEVAEREGFDPDADPSAEAAAAETPASPDAPVVPDESDPSDELDELDDLDALDELDDFDLQTDVYGMAEFPDPLEPVNRVVFRFNREVDRWVMDPVTRVYGFVVPDLIKTGVRNFFLNLDGPVVMLNDMLQLEWKDAGVTGSRFVINTTAGVAGVWDPAVRLGLPWHHSDFGQTLALAGMPSGPYLVLPVLGPTTVRDGVGVGVDVAFNPLTWLIGPIELIGLGSASGISVREEHLESLRALERGSVDFYATFRNAYTQNRRAEIWSRREDRLPQRAEVEPSEHARSE